MNRSGLRKLILGAAIAALSAWVGLEQLLPGTGPAQAGAAPAAAVAQQALLGELSAPAEATIPPAELAARRQLAAGPWPRDPFFRFTAPRHGGADGQPDTAARGAAVQPRYVLSATLGGEKPLAMINGTVMSVGDRLGDGSTITAIDNYAVTLQGPQGPWILRLSE
jgi:hypothetical protein